jgi:hypothetical protein
MKHSARDYGGLRSQKDEAAPLSSELPKELLLIAGNYFRVKTSIR